MLKIKEAVIVEGRYDKNTLLQCVDCTVIETNGFGIFHDSEKAALIRMISDKQGIIILTDSDNAGFLIRNHLKGLSSVPFKHAYIPDIYGKEKRKKVSSKEGKLGVEGMSAEVIIDALKKAGATFLDETDSFSPRRSAGITKYDFYSLGLSGGTDSSYKRKRLLHRLSLPENMSANAMLEAVNLIFSREEFMGIAKEALEL